MSNIANKNVNITAGYIVCKKRTKTYTLNKRQKKNDDKQKQFTGIEIIVE